MIETAPTAFTNNREITLLRLLAHPTRLAVLEILRAGEECVCHMVSMLGLRQAYLSQQLAVLRESGIITDRREGWNHYYRLADPAIIPLLDALKSASGTQPHDEPTRRAGEDCPCPKCSASSRPAPGSSETKL